MLRVFYAFSLDIFWSMLLIQALSTAHPWGIQTHTELQLPIKISPEAKSLLREVRSVEPRYNEPLYNEVLGIANDFLYPSNSKIYGKELRPVPWPFVISRFHCVWECCRDQYYRNTFVLLGGNILCTGPRKGHWGSVHTWVFFKVPTPELEDGASARVQGQDLVFGHLIGRHRIPLAAEATGSVYISVFFFSFF